MENRQPLEGESKLAYERAGRLYVFPADVVVDFQVSSNLLSLRAQHVIDVGQGRVLKNPYGHTAHREKNVSVGDRLMLRHAVAFEIQGGDEDGGFNLIVTREPVPESGWAILKDDGEDKMILVQRQRGSDSFFWTQYVDGDFDTEMWCLVQRQTQESAFALALDLADEKIKPPRSLLGGIHAD